MWYETPADEWMKALPIGNGRLGAMIYGGVTTETIALNESSMWSGSVNPNQNIPFGRERLDSLRQMFFANKIAEGNSIAWNNLIGNEQDFGSHVPLGDIELMFLHPSGTTYTNYRRKLDLQKAQVRVNYSINNIRYTREYVCSHPQQVMAAHYTANRKNAISFDMGAKLLRPEATVRTEQNTLVITGKASQPGRTDKGVLFVVRLKVVAKDGEITTGDSILSVRNANEVTIYADLRTDYKQPDYLNLCRETTEKASARTFVSIQNEHETDYTPLFKRVSLTLGSNPEATKEPTDKRWMAVKKGRDDADLQAIFFQYGRYLTIISSREDSPLPVALQGFFNDNLACNMGWNNDYHLDINTQQNYWLTNVGNLAECNKPLFTYIASLAEAGRNTAKTVYGAQGWTAHTTANIWGFTAPCNCIAWGLFPTAGSWMATHLWTQWEYTQDLDFLRHTAYPLLKGNAQFLLSYMCIDPNTGYFVTGPSISPENSFGYEGQTHSASMMPTVDLVLAREVFQDCLRSTELLNTDAAFADSLRKVLSLLPPLRINKYGGVREWLEDYDDVNVNHRHTSHLLALYPYYQITTQNTPELAKAAYNTLERRLTAQGWEDVEWSRAWAICYFARLRHSQEAYNSINQLIGNLSRENLFTVSPKGIAGAPWDIFAIDGNMAGAAGMAEMLVQSHAGYIEYLPTLPKAWSEGQFTGLCVRGGAEVSAKWASGKVLNAKLKATSNGEFKIKIPDGIQVIKVKGKKMKGFTNDIIRVTLHKGDVVTFS
ncbi:MAG: glycoside hydrolase family 95 protein [Bacteroidaceae bacterium]|nr:glycoside hydrolase family 95 protein [Bacteroidaceae bacterium]